MSVGETVKLRGRWIEEEKKRKAAENLRKLQEEELRIAKMKAKLVRKKRKEERKKKDKERMDKGNRELKQFKKSFNGNESFLGEVPLNCSTQKSVVFDKELTKIRNISPVNHSETLIEIVPFACTPRANDVKDEKKSCDGNVSTMSQQVISPTQHPASKRKRSLRKRRDKYNLPSQETIFNFKQCAQSLLSTQYLSQSEFSLPKEFTPLKLEKIRENQVLQVKSKGESDLFDSEICDAIPNNDKTVPQQVYNMILGSCSTAQLSVLVCISNDSMTVYTSNNMSKDAWTQSGLFTLKEAPHSPFLIVEEDTISIKSFSFDKNHIKESSYVMLGECRNFLNPVLSTQTVLVLTESYDIDNLVSAQCDSELTTVFYNFDKYTRGIVCKHSQSNLKIFYLTTMKGSTSSVHKLKGTPDIALSSVDDKIYLWNIKIGVCIKMIELESNIISEYILIDSVVCQSKLYMLCYVKGDLLVGTVNKCGLTVHASCPISLKKEDLKSSNHSLLGSVENILCILIGNLLLNWHVEKKLIDTTSVKHPNDLRGLVSS